MSYKRITNVVTSQSVIPKNSKKRKNGNLKEMYTVDVKLKKNKKSHQIVPSFLKLQAD